MDENEYRAFYRSVNRQRCPFEKAVLSRTHACNNLIKHNIGEREAAGCRDADACERCTSLLSILREKARFVVQSTDGKQQLGHAKEIRIQAGGLTGLAGLLAPDNDNEAATGRVEDIDGMLTTLLQRYSSLEEIPYSAVMPAVASYEGRKQRRRNKKDKT